MDLAQFLTEQAQRYNQPNFIADDPIQIPHRFSKLPDIEIAAFWTAMLAWGQRKTIIQKCTELLAMMDNAPLDFMLGHTDSDLRPLTRFVHRTFNATDALYFVSFFAWYYRQYASLETAFAQYLRAESPHVGDALKGFHHLFFSLNDAPQRTRKHVATPERGSTCKRLNMFLRWMVRRDSNGVDFGLWQQIKPAQLLIPLDVHVERVSRALGLLSRPQTDWKAVLELTENLRQIDPKDPVRFDFALFGLGVAGRI